MKTGKRSVPKLPARVQRIVDKVKSGAKVCVYQHRKPSGETEDSFFFEPGGRYIPEKSARAAIKCGALKPSGDGLFGADTSQTWVSA